MEVEDKGEFSVNRDAVILDVEIPRGDITRDTFVELIGLVRGIEILEEVQIPALL
jgi:hypothetical protein